jgi:hypothetical protein
MDNVSLSIEYEDRVRTYVEGCSQQSRGVALRTTTTHKPLIDADLQYAFDVVR